MSELRKEILAGVSRSFYLSLNVLPEPVRAPFSLAYLLARAADTVADTDAVPPRERLQFLQRMHDRVCEGREDIALTGDLCTALTDKLDHPKERLLLERLDQCLAWFDGSPEDEKAEIKRVLEIILRGQSLDVERFELTDGASALPDAETLDEYTYLVAGCVGEFWTNLSAMKLGDKFTAEPLPVMLERARRYGKGLQLVNVIRDFPKDLRERGRCYWPLPELHAAGLENGAPLESLLDSPEIVERVSAPWKKLCREHLAEAMDYVHDVKNRRTRLATALPVLLAYKTLDAIEAADWPTYLLGVKVNRKSVRRELLRSARIALFR
ncbi:MAG: squalene/phytoene synthase family protein [Verrucomicrobiae bacterium]|nr:squalene/phytoene synthase family protein [Verrucomicrobiae bacterium]